VGGQQTRGLAPIRHPQAAQDNAHPVIDGVGRDVQRAGDLLRPHAAQDHPQNLAVTLRKPRYGLLIVLRPLPHALINDEEVAAV
jgi:hypothetical protein